MLRSKQEHDKKAKGKRQTDVSKRDVTTDNTTEEQSASATSTSYMPPWFDHYVMYKFNLLDRAGQISQPCRCVGKILID